MQSNPVKDQNAKIVVRVNIPVLNLQKAIKVGPTDLIWTVKKQLEEKVRSEIKDILNYALFLHGQGEKQGKYLDERKSLGSYHVDSNSQLDFILKTRVNGEVQDVKKQRRIIEDIQKGNLDKLKEKTTKNVDFNFLLDQDTPLSLAVMNNDPQMIEWLLDNGAFSDFRVGDKENWKAPIHLAALHNKALALKVLLQYAAWPDILDALGLSAIHYAVTAGNSECVLRLLLSKADTEIFDEHGRRPLHQVTRYIQLIFIGSIE
ncbi:ankyrin repeat-containing domain protein [Globomyces pollinis-pini]|nr:ankyrin repeat-containing domain protein [Globomyces pollinis-pini]